MSYIDKSIHTIYLTREEWNKIEEIERRPLSNKAIEQFIKDTNNEVEK